MNTQPKLDLDHPVFERFAAAGYPPETLTDPGYVTPAEIEDGGWRAVVWNSQGVLSYDIDPSSVRHEGWSPSGVTVQFNHSGGTHQPIAFADESGPLNADLPSMEKLEAGASTTVTMFAGPDAERSFPSLTERGAIQTLGMWGSEGHMPRGTAEAIIEPFGIDPDGDPFREDPDADGVEIIRPPVVATWVARAALGEAKSADSGITGHKKTRRQRFYRNLDALKSEYGISDD